uniref:Uncharacterized protein n=1 Tax=Vespula pensylvanica TaxID=30213 RepID=A0A834P1R2_VESPE|nr:hypothetical protein H0235_007750 [Vespula pensylvanica]
MVQPLRVRARRSTSDNRRFPSSSGRPLGLSRVAAPTVKETQRYPREEAPDRPDETRKGESNGLEQSNINLSKLPRDDREGLRLVKYLYGTSWSLMEPRGGSWLTSKERGLG